MRFVKLTKEVDRIEKVENIEALKCPKCGSTNIKTISETKKAILLGIFGGLAKKKILNNYICKNCRHKFK